MKHPLEGSGLAGAGARNACSKKVAEKVAEVKDVPVEQLLEAVYVNSQALFFS